MKLGVNIDHVATLRQARGTAYPDVGEAAEIAVAAGADGITVHLREDRRHIQLHDVEHLRQSLTVPLNLEMAATREMQEIARRIQPDEVCIVPERREELTTEGGLEVHGQRAYLEDFCGALRDRGIKVSLFIDPLDQQIAAAAAIGVDAVELHTGQYAESSDHGAPDAGAHLARLQAATRFGLRHGLTVNAGHGLNYDNVGNIVEIAGIACLNIGHAIIARAVMVGLHNAVETMAAKVHTRSAPE